MRGRHARHRRALTVALIGAGTVMVLFVVALGLAYRTYEQIRGPLRSAQATLTALAHNRDSLSTPAGRRQSEVLLARASEEVAAAQHQIDGSVGLKILGLIPGLHTQRVGLDQLIADLHSTMLSTAALLVSVDTVAADSHGTQIALPALQALGTVLGRARDQLRADNRSASGLWGPLGAERQKFDGEDSRAVHLLGLGEDLIRYALPFLGADGPRTYLVVGENNAEMRDEGATISYALMSTLNGTITVSNGGTASAIELSSPAPGLAIPAGTQTVFGQLEPTQLWPSTNASADFSFSGRAMQAMFATATGKQVDGVIGIDVVALQGLLALTGPVTVPGLPEPVTAQNGADVLLHQLYAGLSPGSSQGPRREELAAVTSATFHQLQGGTVDLVALARSLATSVGGRHLQLWDGDPAYERTIRDVGASGDIDTVDPTGTFHIAVENATATKLDYYVTVAISDKVYVLGNGDAQVNTSVTLTNSAPAGQPASYQLGPDGINSHVPGEYVGRVLLWGPRGSSQQGSVAESGLMLNEQDLRLLPGQSAAAQFETTIPHAVQGGKLSLVFVPQPRLSPETLTVHVVDPNLEPRSAATVRATLTGTTTLTWYVSGRAR